MGMAQEGQPAAKAGDLRRCAANGNRRRLCSNSTARLRVRQQLRVSAWNRLCDQLRLLICSPLVMRPERGEERKHTGSRLYSGLICKSFQQLTYVSKPVLTRGVTGGDSCAQLLFLLGKRTHLCGGYTAGLEEHHAWCSSTLFLSQNTFSGLDWSPLCPGQSFSFVHRLERGGGRKSSSSQSLSDPC